MGNGLEHRYVIFRIGAEEYGLPVTAVNSIIRYEQATPVPRAPQGVLGVINLRGRVIPVVDLRLRFSATPFAPMPGRTMRGWVLLPKAIVEDDAALDAWVARSEAHAGEEEDDAQLAERGVGIRVGQQIRRSREAAIVTGGVKEADQFAAAGRRAAALPRGKQGDFATQRHAC